MATIEYVMKPQGVVLEEFADCRARNSFIMGNRLNDDAICDALKSALCKVLDTDVAA